MAIVNIYVSNRIERICIFVKILFLAVNVSRFEVITPIAKEMQIASGVFISKIIGRESF